MLADMMKLCGNAAFGRSGMDKSKHKDVSYETNVFNVQAIVERQNFNDVEELNGSFEVSTSKRKIKMNNPIQVSIAIYQLAKLRMLQFYYDSMDVYFDRSDFEYLEMDTDITYIAFSNENPFDELIKPHMVEHYKDHRSEWFPRDGTEDHRGYDMFTPDLFKKEWQEHGMISLSSKNYMCFNPTGLDAKGNPNKEKLSAKGVQKNKNASILKPSEFKRIINERTTIKATNMGFRVCKKTKGMVTYYQLKTGINYWYDKRKVLPDGISTVALDI